MHIGDQMAHRGVVWTVVGQKTVTRRDGTEAVMWVFETPCHDCGRPAQTARVMFDAGHMNRRCPDHAKPGVRAKGEPRWLRTGVFG